MNILLASKQQIKIQAVEEAFTDCKITAIDANSEVNEQPMGGHEIMRGAINRFNYIKEYSVKNFENSSNFQNFDPKNMYFDMFISIENGIISIPSLEKNGELKFLDTGCVIVETNGKKSMQFTGSIPMPFECVKKSKDTEFSKTAASFLQLENPNDPHKKICGINRKIFLNTALITAYRDCVK